MLRALRSILLSCALLLLDIAGASAQIEVGTPAPPFRAELIGGGTFDSASQRGKVIVLNFWATWCKPCREEMPALEAYYRAHRAKGLEVIAISIEGPEDLGKVKNVMKSFSFPAALASGAQTQGYGRLWRIPITFVIDRRGVLRFDGFKFAKTLDSRTLEKIVTPLLREPRATAEVDLGAKTRSGAQG
ncbi:MAG: TlpA family protein disulfide reductase [Betaproteobacteria bacterium]|nr:TlpA family protein disulfide reductase [Betaproteobacteria bacterium]